MDELQYLEKYLKYKQKYLELDNEGGAKIQEFGTKLRVSGIKFNTAIKNFSTKNINSIEEDFKLPTIDYPKSKEINNSQLQKLDQYLVYISAYTKYAISAITALENKITVYSTTNSSSTLNSPNTNIPASSQEISTPPRLGQADLNLINVNASVPTQNLSQELPSPNPTTDPSIKSSSNFTFTQTNLTGSVDQTGDQTSLTPRSAETIKKEQEEKMTAVGGFFKKKGPPATSAPTSPVATQVISPDTQIAKFREIMTRAKKQTYFINKTMDILRELLKQAYSSDNQIAKKDPIREIYMYIISIKQSGTILSKVSDEDKKQFPEITGDEIEFSESDLSRLKQDIIDFYNQISLNENNIKKDISIDLLKLCKTVKFNDQDKDLNSLRKLAVSTKDDIDSAYNAINKKFEDFYTNNPLNKEDIKTDAGKLRDSIQLIVNNIVNVKKSTLDSSCITKFCPLIGFRDFNFDDKLMAKKGPSLFRKLKDIFGIRKADISSKDLQQFLNNATEPQLKQTLEGAVDNVREELENSQGNLYTMEFEQETTVISENNQQSTAQQIFAAKKIKEFVMKRKFEPKLQNELVKAHGDLGVIMRDKNIPYEQRKEILKSFEEQLSRV
jgi:hypothetical protein